MLIFDGFRNVKIAALFAAEVENADGRGWSILSNQQLSNMLDPFPFALLAPIVLTERTEADEDAAIIELAREYGGRFAGT